MYYKFNHHRSIDNGAIGPLPKLQQLANMAGTMLIHGYDHNSDCIEAPASEDDRKALECILHEEKMIFEIVENLPMPH
jgi:hypothetical protein